MKEEFGQSIFIPPFKGRIQPKYRHPLFIKAISDCQRLLDNPKSEILLDSRNRVGAVALPLPGGKRVEIVIKEFRSLGVNRLKSIFLPAKAFKAWRGGNALLERGIGTPFPVAYLERRKAFFLDQSFFLAERLTRVEEIRPLLREFPSSELQELLASLAQHISLCHRKGILHRDLSDGNILVRKEKDGRFRFYLIDTNRIRIKRHIGLLKAVKNLIRLGIPPDYQHLFLEQYLSPKKLKRYLWCWYKTNKMVYSWYIEFKKKLRLKQLARKLKIQ
jgi:serine/threonine protein kinase